MCDCVLPMHADAPDTGWGAGENGLRRVMECTDPAIDPCYSRPPAETDLFGVPAPGASVLPTRLRSHRLGAILCPNQHFHLHPLHHPRSVLLYPCVPRSTTHSGVFVT